MIFIILIAGLLFIKKVTLGNLQKSNFRQKIQIIRRIAYIVFYFGIGRLCVKLVKAQDGKVITMRKLLLKIACNYDDPSTLVKFFNKFEMILKRDKSGFDISRKILLLSTDERPRPPNTSSINLRVLAAKGNRVTEFTEAVV